MPTDTQPTIAHLINTLAGGGTEHMLLRLLQTFNRDQFRHVVITMREGGSLCAQLPDHVAVHAMGIEGRARTAGVRIATILRRSGATVLHAGNTVVWRDAILAGWLSRGTQVVLGFHGFDGAARPMESIAPVARWAVRCGCRVTSVSQAGAAELADGAGIPASAIQLLPNGVDTDRYFPRGAEVCRDVRATLGFAPDDYVVGMVGSLSPIKRHELLLEAAACCAPTMPRLRLMIVGDGPRRAELEQIADRLGHSGRVLFTGTRDDIPELLAAMNLFVCCSSAEGASNALLEAMASGVPVITTPVGDHAQLISGHRAGIVLEEQTPRALAAAMESALLISPVERRPTVIRSLQASAAEYEAYYAALIAAPHHIRKLQRRGLSLAERCDCSF